MAENEEKRPLAEHEHKKVVRDGDAVLKQFDSTYPKANVFNEALNQVRVEETDLNLPHVRDVRQHDGEWTIVMDYIPGKTMAEKMEEDPEHAEDYIRQLVELQCEVHDHEAPDLLPSLREKMRRKLASGELPVDPSERYELQSRLDSMPRHKKLIHGDFEPRNIIYGEDGKMYIIDWSHASRGNASADAAKTYMVLMLQHGKDLADFYLNEFSQEAEIPKQLIQRWTPLMAASHLLRTNERHKEFLMGWLDVMEGQ
ncbi:MAG: phosphotransferase [Clostridia bacterium]|nr:phosphotransferase [Clostridia bacterium]